MSKSGRPVLLELEHGETGLHEVHVGRYAGIWLRWTGEDVSAELRASVEPSDGGTNEMAVVFPRTTFPGFIPRAGPGPCAGRGKQARSEQQQPRRHHQPIRPPFQRDPIGEALHRRRELLDHGQPSKPSRCSSGVEGTRGGTSQSSHSGSAPVSLPPARSRTSIIPVVRLHVEHESLPIDPQLADRLPRRPIGRLDA